MKNILQPNKEIVSKHSRLYFWKRSISERESECSLHKLYFESLVLTENVLRIKIFSYNYPVEIIFLVEPCWLKPTMTRPITSPTPTKTVVKYVKSKLRAVLFLGLVSLYFGSTIGYFWSKLNSRSGSIERVLLKLVLMWFSMTVKNQLNYLSSFQLVFVLFYVRVSTSRENVGISKKWLFCNTLARDFLLSILVALKR